MNKDLLKLDGFDEAIIGVCMTWNNETLVERIVYDGNKIIELLKSDGEMDEEEAQDYLDFNIIGAYMGEATPIVMWPTNAEGIDECS
jgi:hypothetical protein